MDHGQALGAILRASWAHNIHAVVRSVCEIVKRSNAWCRAVTAWTTREITKQLFWLESLGLQYSLLARRLRLVGRHGGVGRPPKLIPRHA